MKACLGDKWQVYDLRHVIYCAQKDVRGLMFSRGYWEAKIAEPQSQITGEEVELSLGVSEGIRYRLGEINVTGATAFTKKEIIEMVGQRAGDIANGTALEDALDEKLKRAYDDKGFVQFVAEFEPTFFPPDEDEHEGRVNVDITIDEGQAFKIKQIRFKGIDAEQEQILLSGLLLKTDDLFNRTKLADDIKKIDRSNEFQKIDPDADVALRTDEEDSGLEIIITLKPRIPSAINP